MSVVTYDAGQMLLTIDDTGVERALGSLYRKTPAVLKVAINRTARQARKDLIAEAEKRYALTVRGKARLLLTRIKKPLLSLPVAVSSSIGPPCRVRTRWNAGPCSVPQSGDLVTIDEGTKEEQLFTLKSCEDENAMV